MPKGSRNHEMHTPPWVEELVNTEARVRKALPECHGGVWQGRGKEVCLGQPLKHEKMGKEGGGGAAGIPCHGTPFSFSTSHPPPTPPTPQVGAAFGPWESPGSCTGWAKRRPKSWTLLAEDFSETKPPEMRRSRFWKAHAGILFKHF